MNTEITNLVELVFDISKLIPDQTYMDIMNSIQKINNFQSTGNKNEPGEFELLYYKLLRNHNTLKRNYRRISKNRKEQMEQMEETIEALQNEIQYLHQKKPENIKGTDFILV